MFWRVCIIFLLAIASPCGVVTLATAQGLDYVKANYTKYEYRIPMRDGCKLFTSVYVPKDDSVAYPLLLKRTPYGLKPYGADQYPENLGPSKLFAEAGYIFVYQDVRGRWMSEGEFDHMRPHQSEKPNTQTIDESSDTWDTVEWLINNVKGHNGRVGIAGISYPGFYTAAGIIDSHPAIRAASPQAPVTDWFAGDDWHHNGAFFMAHMFNWMSGSGRVRPEPTKDYRGPRFDYGTPDGYAFFKRLQSLSEIDEKYLHGEAPFWTDSMRHGTYDDFWKTRNIRPHLKNVKPAVLNVGGWFDAENLFGALETYKSIEANNPTTHNTLVMGPWRHGQWASDDGASLGDVSFNAKTSEFYRQKIELPFFEYYLKDVRAEES
ncbi:MAG: CocE/NonD family hydrolase, partial [Planctomycetales bacterium]|nr:CocE/NonD family hydrolase [Planctomycetales bacterium]